MEKNTIVELYNKNIILIDEIVGLFTTEFLQAVNQNLIQGLADQKANFTRQLSIITDDTNWNKFSSDQKSELKSLLDGSLKNNDLQLYYSKSRI